MQIRNIENPSLLRSTPSFGQQPLQKLQELLELAKELNQGASDLITVPTIYSDPSNPILQPRMPDDV